MGEHSKEEDIAMNEKEQEKEILKTEASKTEASKTAESETPKQGESTAGAEAAASEAEDAQSDSAPEEERGPDCGADKEADSASDQEAVGEDGGKSEKSDAAGTSNSEKKGFFKKNKKKDKKDEKIEELTDQVKRQMAEFDNFRKRTEKEKSQMYEIGAKSIIEKVLPVVDNFERGLAAVPEENKEDAFVDGMNKIYKQMVTMLEEAGVKPIEAVGQEFNPDLHNAVMQTESEEYESGIVAQELQKGYMYRDSVVRHSMVAVVS